MIWLSPPLVSAMRPWKSFIASSWTATGGFAFGAASAIAGTPTRAADDATAMAAARERRVLRKGVLQRTCGIRPPMGRPRREVIPSRAKKVTLRKRLVTKASRWRPESQGSVTNRFFTFTDTSHRGLTEHAITPIWVRLVQHRRLPGGDSALLLVEEDPQAAALVGHDLAGHRSTVRAQLHLRPERQLRGHAGPRRRRRPHLRHARPGPAQLPPRPDRRPGGPAGPRRRRRPPLGHARLLRRPDGDRARHRLDREDVARPLVTDGDAQAAALADGEAERPVVLPHR